VKIFKILAGVILILSGVFCFANPGATFSSVAFLLGLGDADRRDRWDRVLFLDRQKKGNHESDSG